MRWMIFRNSYRKKVRLLKMCKRYMIIFIMLSFLSFTCIYYFIGYYNLKQIYSAQQIESFQVNYSYLYENLRCYANHEYNDNEDDELQLYKIDDILSNKRKPKKGKTIFFHETSCSKTGYFKLNARQACAIESAALLNPNFDIFVLFASPIVLIKNQSEYDFHIHKTLKQYKNIYFRNVNLWKYADNTPIAEWFSNGHLFYSRFIESHTSDFLRYLTLWRWGGTHLDLDIILKKTLENIKPNFLGIESRIYVGSAVINLDYTGIGNKIANMFLEYCQEKFDPYIRNSIGPPLITQVMNIICKTKFTLLMQSNWCSGFKVFHKGVFYAIEWANSIYIFDENHLNKSLMLTHKSVAIHIWNELSKKFVVKYGSKVAYNIFAEQYCPKVYKSYGHFF